MHGNMKTFIKKFFPLNLRRTPQTGKTVDKKEEYKKKTAPKPKTPKPQTRVFLSLIVAAYNAESYIDQALASIFNQSAKFKNFEVIVVDDGSIDRTGDIVAFWVKRYPHQIHYIRQDNKGAGAARNAGLDIATGIWVGFPDSDDFLDADYFKHMLKEIRKEHTRPLLAVISNLIFYFEDDDELSDTHPLRYRFQNGIVRKSSSDLGAHMQLSGATAWLHRDTIRNHKVRFDARVVPGFEDAHFINHLFLSNQDRTVSFVPNAKYFYRKRANKSSLIDNARKNPKWYTDQLQYGPLDVLRSAKDRLGHVPEYIQRTCLYDVIWKVRSVVDKEDNVAHLSDEQRKTFLALLTSIFEHIDSDTIDNFHLAGCNEEHKVGLLYLYKKTHRSNPTVQIKKIDTLSGIIQFSYFSDSDDKVKLQVFVNGALVEVIMPSQRQAKLLDKTYFCERFAWVDCKDGDCISFSYKDKKCRIKCEGSKLGKTVTWLQLQDAIKKPAPESQDAETLQLRNHVIATKDQYQDCIIITDGPSQAGKNAEQLYRYMMMTGRHEKSWFVLSPQSSDWPRLKFEGFQLLAYNTAEHIAMQLNARFLISSDADDEVIWPVKRKDFKDLARYEFIYLPQHIITSDHSRWLNKKPIRLMTTSTPNEYKSITAVESTYILSERETVLSGLPRHDDLSSRAAGEERDSILIALGREEHLSSQDGAVNELGQKAEGDLETAYLRKWRAVLESPKLEKIAAYYNLRVVLAHSQNVAIFFKGLNLPNFIKIENLMQGSSDQHLLVKATILLTDYAHTAMDMAYLQRPVVYFQLDQDKVFTERHAYRNDYFSFARDGFGPVTQNAEDFLDRVEDALAGRENPIFAERRLTSFPLRDGQCCARICDAIDTLRTASTLTEEADHIP